MQIYYFFYLHRKINEYKIILILKAFLNLGEVSLFFALVKVSVESECEIH